MRQQRLFEVLSIAIEARHNCETREPRNEEWFVRWTERIEQLCKEFMPCGSGIDNGTTIDLERSHADKLVFNTHYHHMNEGGYYDGWTDHTVTVTPSLSRAYHIRIGGRDRSQIKDHLHEEFEYALCTIVEWDTAKEQYVRAVTECYVPAC